MEQRGNKTLMCSVLFLDIVAYSKKSVSSQIAEKELFNTLLGSSILNVPVDDRVILDTGDGAAITFLGDIEDALKAVLVFRESLLDKGAIMDPHLLVRMGINLGPVCLVKDINGQPNIVGDGINVAQRVMGFANPGQILVSRSYFDAVSRLSHEYAGMFYHEGLRTDKHVREHELYAIGPPSESAGEQKQTDDTLGLALKQNPVPITERWLQGILATFRNASGQQRALYVGITASALTLLIVVAMKILHRSEAPSPQVAVEAQITPATKEKDIQQLSSSRTQQAMKIPHRSEAPASQVAAEAQITPAAKEKDIQQLSSSRTQQETAAKEHTAKKPIEAKHVAMGSVIIGVIPWGEVYLDGKMQGVTPPLDALHVTPGKHEVEIRNTTFPPYTLSIDIKANEQLKIKHKFAN